MARGVIIVVVCALAGAALGAEASQPKGMQDTSLLMVAQNGTQASIRANNGAAYGALGWEAHERFSFSDDVTLDGELAVEGDIHAADYEWTMEHIELMVECNDKGYLSNGESCSLPESYRHNKRVKDLVPSLSYQMCAIMEDDSLRCWGHFAYGMEGTGQDHTVKYLPFEHSQTYDNKVAHYRLYNRRTRMLPVALSYAAMIVACSDGLAYVTGYGGNGLGDGSSSTTYFMSQINLAFLNNVTTVAIGGDNSHPLFCAIDGTSTLYCWGYNGYGQVGAGDTSNPKKVPVRVNIGANSPKIKMVDITYHQVTSVCATDEDGHVWCWGYGGYGQLGYGSNSNTDTAQQVRCSSCGGKTYLDDVEYVKMHGGQVASSYAIKYDNTLWSWGYNGHGQLGIGSTANRNTALQTQNGMKNELMKDVRDVFPSNGDRYGPICLTTLTGALYCWGYNGKGGCGVGDTSQRNKPSLVPEVTNAIHFENPRIYDHSYNYRPGGCSLTSDGDVWCQGYNGNGVLGVGDSSQRNSPVKVHFVGGATQLASRCYGASGNDCTFFAVNRDGYEVFAWGYGGHGQTAVRMDAITYNPIADHVRMY